MLPKIAIVVSHPIQHFCPQYISYSKSDQWKIKVFFASSLGFKEYESPGFGGKIKWGNLGLDQFPHEFLNNCEPIMPSRKLDAIELNDRLSCYDPDVVVVYGYWQKFQRRAVQYAKCNNKKIFFISDSEMRHNRSLFLNNIKKLYLKKYFSDIDAFLSVGDANEEYYTYYGVARDKFIRTPFPIGIDLYKDCFKDREIYRKLIRDKFHIAENTICCTVVGKLLDYKCQMDIIKAINLLGEIDIAIVLLIVGTGPMLDQLKSQIQLNKHRVELVGFVQPDELPHYYAATDIYIHPSKRDAHSLSISEAIYMGCPVIISDKCGSYGETDDVQVNKNGFVFECGNVVQLKSYIHQLVNDHDLRNRFGEVSHKIALKSQEKAHSLGIKKALQENNLLIDNCSDNL